MCTEIKADPPDDEVERTYREMFLEVCRNPFLVKHIISKRFKIRELMEEDGLETVYCPFHDDKASGKPSIKIYEDEDEIERLYCFSENKQFTSYDYIKLVQGQDPLKYLTSENLLSEENIEDYIEEVDHINKQKENLQIDHVKNAFANSSGDINLFLMLVYS